MYRKTQVLQEDGSVFHIPMMPPGKLKVSKAKVDGGDVPSIWSNEIFRPHTTDGTPNFGSVLVSGNGTPKISGKSIGW